MWLVLAIISVITIQITTAIECDHTKTECEIWLTIQEKLTMTWGTTRVYAKNGTLYKFNEMPWDNSTKVPVEEVITMDGFPRSVITVNGTVPGPPIIAYADQTLTVHVKNHLLSESITIHWHGLHMRETPFMDGVAFITQCPINAGQSFTYKFKAYPSGTFWYHSHIGGQRVDGLFGALIIKRREERTQGIQDIIMHAGDWFHVAGSTLHTKMILGNFKSQPGFVQAKTLDGVYFAPTIFKSAHIEGRGTYYDAQGKPFMDTPLKEYNVQHGSTYRFRVINPGTLFPFRVSIDQHPLLVISTDGFDVLPRSFESIVINPGERYDFLLTANQTINDYWIRVDGMEVNFPGNNARGILRYGNSNSNPSSSRISCTNANPCHVLNCQFSYYPKVDNTICVRLDQLQANGGETVPVFDESSMQWFQNWVQMPGGMGVNGILFEHPGVNSLTQPEEVSMALNCDQANCEDEKVCKCHNEIELPYDKTIQLVLTNHGKGATRHHPIHIHGHSFHVLKLAYGEYNSTSGLKTSDNTDINCEPDKLCNNPRWTNSSWKGNNIPGLNLVNPPQKDTLMLPAGAYAVVRFRSSNPGKWFLHCHIEFHSMQGMALILNEAKERHRSPPPGFPVCQNFQHNVNEDKDYVRRDQMPTEADDDDEKDILLIFVIILAVIIFIETIAIIIYCIRQSKSNGGSSKGKNIEMDSKIRT